MFWDSGVFLENEIRSTPTLISIENRYIIYKIYTGARRMQMRYVIEKDGDEICLSLEEARALITELTPLVDTPHPHVYYDLTANTPFSGFANKAIDSSSFEYVISFSYVS